MKPSVISLLLSMIALSACASCTTENNDSPVTEEPAANNPEDNGNIPVIRLNSGYYMPIAGLRHEGS